MEAKRVLKTLNQPNHQPVSHMASHTAIRKPVYAESADDDGDRAKPKLVVYVIIFMNK